MSCGLFTKHAVEFAKKLGFSSVEQMTTRYPQINEIITIETQMERQKVKTARDLDAKAFFEENLFEQDAQNPFTAKELVKKLNLRDNSKSKKDLLYALIDEGHKFTFDDFVLFGKQDSHLSKSLVAYYYHVNPLQTDNKTDISQANSIPEFFLILNSNYSDYTDKDKTLFISKFNELLKKKLEPGDIIYNKAYMEDMIRKGRHRQDDFLFRKIDQYWSELLKNQGEHLMELYKVYGKMGYLDLPSFEYYLKRSVRWNREEVLTLKELLEGF